MLLDNISLKFKTNDEITETVQLLKQRYSYLTSHDELQSEYRCFQSLRSDELDKAFREQCPFQTTIRGIKVRGAYDTIQEATARAKSIAKFDNKFDVFIAEIGCWCPWSPFPDQLKDSEYAETQLNTLMKKYHENREGSEELYMLRKKEMSERAASHQRPPSEQNDDDHTKDDASTTP